MERNHGIDIAKGILIILVVIGHSYSGDNIGNYVEKTIYAFHMPSFFIISGILFSLVNNKKNINSFDFKKKIRQLLVPYFIFELLYSICISVTGGFIQLVDNLLLTFSLIGVAGTWFLPCLYMIEFIFYILHRNLKKICIIITVCLFVMSLFLPLKSFWIIPIRCFIGLGFYAIGFYFSEILLLKQHLAFFLASAVLFLFSVVFNDNIDLYSLTFGNQLFYVISSITGSYCLLQLSLRIGDRKERLLKLTNLIEYYGKNTLIILCTHIFVVRIIKTLDEKLADGFLVSFGSFQGIVVGIIVMAIEIPIVFLCNRYLRFLFYYKPKS